MAKEKETKKQEERREEAERVVKFKPAIVKLAAEIGSAETAKALTRMSKKNVEVVATEVKTMELKGVATELEPLAKQPVIAYAQLLAGVPGASLLILSRENTLMLVDLLNEREIGVTGILQAADLSAIEETLNILSNSYMTALAESLGIKLGLSAPRVVTAARIGEIVIELLRGESRGPLQAVVFKTSMDIPPHEIKIHLFIMVSAELEKMVKEIKE